MGLTKLVVRGARQHNLKNISVEIPAERPHRHHRPFRLRQILSRLRHHLCRRPAPLRRIALRLRAAVSRPDGTPRSGRHRRAFAFDCHRAKNHHALAALHRRHHHRNLRLPARRLRSVGVAALPQLRQAHHAPVQRTNRPIHLARRTGQAGRPHHDPRAHRARTQRRIPQGARKFRADGYVRVRINGELFPLDAAPGLDKRKNHTIEVVMDRLLVKPGIAARLEQSHCHGAETGKWTRHGLHRRRRGTYFLRETRVPRLRHFRSATRAALLQFQFAVRRVSRVQRSRLEIRFRSVPKSSRTGSRPLFDGGLGPGSASAVLKRTLELAAYAHGFDLDTPFEKFPRARAKFAALWLSAFERQARQGENGAAAQKARREKATSFSRHLRQFLDSNFGDSESDTYREWMTQYMSADAMRRLPRQTPAPRIASPSSSPAFPSPISPALSIAVRAPRRG